tara:strand:+ start:172 stop:471 length:300 start_codon:yes stop_codon:yes gene_type:complete
MKDTTQQLRDTMKELGFIDELWHVGDVYHDYPGMTKRDARRILEEVLGSEEVHEFVYKLIEKKCEDEGWMTEKEWEQFHERMERIENGEGPRYYGPSYG